MIIMVVRNNINNNNIWMRTSRFRRWVEELMGDRRLGRDLMLLLRISLGVGRGID